MTNKKRVKKSKKSGVMNKRIWIGLTIFIVFILLFVFTLKQTVVKEIPFEQLTPEERLDYVQKTNENNENAANLNRAKLYADRAYCDLITDNKLRTKCLAEVPEYAPEVPEDTRTSSEKEDTANYNKAALLGDISYCDFISDTVMKSKCVSELS